MPWSSTSKPINIFKKNISIFSPLVCLSIQHAAELVKTVASRYDEYVSVKDLTEKINRALTAAKKDNDFIYHDRVPEVKDLEHIGKAALVKATSITPPLSQKFTGEIHKLNSDIKLSIYIWVVETKESVLPEKVLCQSPCQFDPINIRNFKHIVWLSVK